MIAAASSLADLGKENARAQKEPERTIRLSSQYFLIGLAAAFASSALLDVGMIFVGPILLATFVIWALILVGRGLWVARNCRQQPIVAVPAVMAPMLAATAFVVGLMPMMAAGEYVQAATTLLLHQRAYERTMAGSPGLLPDQIPATTVGTGKAAMWSFSYGGFLSMERDIIFDPLDRPERRSRALLGASDVTCTPLWSHYYDCFLDL